MLSNRMDVKFFLWFILTILLSNVVFCVELTFELEDNAKQCFFEDIAKGETAIVEYQVISGGRYDIDCEVEDQNGLKIYSEKRKQYDSHQWTAPEDSTYQLCFSNEFSTISHKVVYFEFSVGDEKPLIDSMGQATALTQMETSCVTIHEALKSTVSYQTKFRLRESQGRIFAESVNTKVQIWSIIQLVIMICVMASQVFIVRSFFAAKQNVNSRTVT